MPTSTVTRFNACSSIPYLVATITDFQTATEANSCETVLNYATYSISNSTEPDTGLSVFSREVGFMRWPPVAFLANGVYCDRCRIETQNS